MRPTLRVLLELGLEIPSLEVSLADLEHPVFAKARDMAGSFPKNLIRIQGIRDEMVFRFTHGRYRGVAWRDDATDVVWVCACELRDDDTYDEIIELHERGNLLPTDADSERLGKEAALMLGRELIAGVPEWVRGARDEPGRERRCQLSNGVEIRLICRPGDGVEELWLAMPTLQADVPGLSPNARAMLAALVEQELGDSVWELRYDWPAGALHSWEVARLGIGEN